MRVARLHGTQDLRLHDEEKPRPKEGEVLVRVGAVGVCGSDIHWFADGGIGDVRVVRPFVLGHEFGGTTEDGRRVAVDPAIPCERCESCAAGHANLCQSVRYAGDGAHDGGLGEWVAWPERCLVPLPAPLTEADGAMLEPLGIAIHALDLAHLRMGARVGVFGCGPIGLLLVQLARLTGAQAVLATDLHDYRLRLAKTAGATATFNAAREDPVAAMLEATGGRGAEVVFEAAGAPETPDQAAQLAAALGTVVVVGICADNRTAFTAAPARRKGLTVKISRRMKPVYARTIALAAHGMVDLESFVSHRVPLKAGPRAFQALADYHEDAAKVVISPA